MCGQLKGGIGYADKVFDEMTESVIYADLVL